MPTSYILYSNSINRYYIGSTDLEIEERLKKHLSNHDGFTAKAKDWKVVYCKHHSSTSEARKNELKIKKSKSRKVIEELVDEYHNTQPGSASR